MKKNKRKFALLLAAAMLASLLTGCGGGSGDTTQSGETGRFSETEIALPEGIDDMQTMALLEDGSLALLAENSDTYCILKSSDLGESWDVTPLEGLEESYISPAAIAPDGTVALFDLYYPEKGEDYEYTLKLASPQGEITEVDFQPGNEISLLMQAAYDSSGNLFAIDTKSHLLKINTEDGSYSQPFDTNGTYISYIGVAGQTLCAVYEDGILLFDTETGEALDSEGVLDDIVKNTEYASPSGYDRGTPMIFAQGDGDSILFVNHEGIFQHAKGGSINEQLADGSLNSLNNPDLVFLSVIRVDADNIIVAAFTDGSEKLMHYTYDGTASAVPEKELTVYALEDSTLLRQAVTVFQKDNPDVYVKLEIGASGEDGVTTEDALKVLNTNIMAGKGPDVLILDGMPLDSYIEKNILEDISDVLDEVDEQDGLFSNIRDAYQQDGKQYVMPVRFLASLVTGDAETVAAGSNLEKLADRAEALQKQTDAKYILLPWGSNGLLDLMYYADSAAWKKSDNTVDSEKLKAYLAQVKRLYDVDSHDSQIEKEISDNYRNFTMDDLSLGSADNTGLLAGLYRIGFGTFAGMSQLQLLYSVQEQSGTTFGLLDTDSTKSFVPYLMAGVVSGGDTDTAKQFVKTLLGKDVNSGSSYGIPVNRAAYDADCQEVMGETDTQMMMSSYSEEGEAISIEYIPLTQEQVDSCTTMLESLTEPSMTDRVIQSLVLEQGEKYLTDTQDLDTTVNEIQKKINLYLSE